MVPVEELASYIPTKCDESAHPPNRTTWVPGQRIASPGCNASLPIVVETVGNVDVVWPGVGSIQHIETKPEQSVLYPS